MKALYHFLPFIKLFLIFIAFLIPWGLEAEDRILEVGQTLELPLTGSRVWVENGRVIKAEAKKGKVILTGRKNGESQVRIGSRVEMIQVLDHKKKKLYGLLQASLHKKPGLQLRLTSGEIEIHGYLHSWDSWKSLLPENDLESTYRIRARLSENLKQNLQTYIDQDLAAQGLLSMNVNLDPHFHVRLHPSQPGIDLYQKYFQHLGIPVVLLKESLTMEPSVRVHITVAEISKSTTRTLGLQWPGTAKFDILPTGLVNAETLQATLSALESQGKAKLLASPNLICRSGKEAEFLAGGEFPIRVKGFGTQDVHWKRFGVLLRIKPFADSSGKMSLSLETEVSSLGEMVDGIPSIKANRVSSHFDLSHSQVIALSGLLRDQNSKGATGLPWLTQIPILGALFSSQDYLEERTELVIFVRPSLINQPNSLKDNPTFHLGQK